MTLSRESIEFQARPIDAARLELVGELDLSTVSILRDALQAMPAGEQVTLDLGRLEFIDSCGLREISMYANSLNGNGPLALVNVPDRITTLLEILAFDTLASIQIS
jgi:anti-anti-sigma factor